MSNDFKNYYKICRENVGLSQERAAELLHISLRTFSDYETGKTHIPEDIIMKMGDIYDTKYLVWWHLKNHTAYGEILLNVYEPSTIGDMMFSYALLTEAADESYQTFKDVYKDRVLNECEVPDLEVAIKNAESAVESLISIIIFAKDKIDKINKKKKTFP